MNERIRELVKKSGGDFWQRIESDGVLNKEAYITFDPPQSLEKFVELVVRECAELNFRELGLSGSSSFDVSRMIKQHFGVEL